MRAAKVICIYMLIIGDHMRYFKGVKIAFFDLDNTITDEDTDYLWMKWAVKLNPLKWLDYLRFRDLMKKYHAGELTDSVLIDYQRKRIGKRSPVEFMAACQRFFMDMGQNHIYGEARSLIEAHSDNGSRTVLITAQHDMIAAPFVDHLSFNNLVASRFAVEGDSFAGPVMPFCYREGKKYWAVEYAKSMGADLADCAFYSDSRNDIPLLDAVGYPVAANPDKTLRIYAMERNLPIIELGRI